MFFISVASKGLRVYVSGLESTLAGISISVDSKLVRGEVILHRSEDCPGDVERIRRPSQAGEYAGPRPIGELGRGQCAAREPVVGRGLVGEPDPHRSEDRPLYGELDPVAVRVTGRLCGNRSSGGRNCGRPCARSRYRGR